MTYSQFLAPNEESQMSVPSGFIIKQISLER